jgi:hypothetical protein
MNTLEPKSMPGTTKSTGSITKPLRRLSIINKEAE